MPDEPSANQPPDSPSQDTRSAAERDQPDASNPGMPSYVIGGNLTVGGDLVTGDKVSKTEIYWLGMKRWQALVLLAILAVVSLVLVIVLSPIVAPFFTKTLPLPDPDKLITIESSKGLSITALAANGNDLWVGAQSKQGYALYHLALNAEPAQEWTPIVTSQDRISRLMVDCKGNVWLLINNVGTMVYRPETGQQSTILTNETPGSTLTKRTMVAIAHRCWEDGKVEVWLGREGVRTLTYDSDYPTPETVTFVPEADDVVYQASKELLDIPALLFTENGATLWVATRIGNVLQVSVSGMFAAKSIDAGTVQAVSLLQTHDRNKIWVGGDKSIASITNDGEVETIPLTEEHGATLSKLADVVAVDEFRVWVGDDCDAADTTCCPLSYFQEGSAACFSRNLSSVQALVLNEVATLWVGMESGLAQISTSK